MTVPRRRRHLPGPRGVSGGRQVMRKTVFRALITLLLASQYNAAAETQLRIKDDMADHVHQAGQAFSLQLTLERDGPGSASYRWQDFRGQVLTAPVMLQPGVTTTVNAPGGHTGYLGLVLEPTIPGLSLPERSPGESREYGFAILPPAGQEGLPDKRSRFGMVHADLKDPYLAGWIKTMTWKTTSPKWWSFEMEKRRSHGLLELPIIVGKEWESDDMQPIGAGQLERLESRIREYFEAHPATVYWEAGIEENLHHRYETPCYWPNLEKKLKAVKSAADKANTDVRLIYQVAELRLQDVRTFLENPASKLIDILSLHPYAWPDFPDPEEWLDNYIKEVRVLLSMNNLDMPVWFTEIGAPHQGGEPGGFFGYPEKGVRVKGKTEYEMVNYMIKLHVMAYAGGVEKIFWYNYRDRKPERDHAENHFGLRDYWGYPKPVYPAYINLQGQLAGRMAGKLRRPFPDLRLYDFDGQDGRVTVAWAYPSAIRQVPLAALLPGADSEDVLGIVDPMGEPIPYTEEAVPISGEPVFIHSRKQADNLQYNSMVRQ
jgi:hypothetical protein